MTILHIFTFIIIISFYAMLYKICRLINIWSLQQ